MTANTTATFTPAATVTRWEAGMLRNSVTGKISSASMAMTDFRNATLAGEPVEAKLAAANVTVRINRAVESLAAFTGSNDILGMRMAALTAATRINNGEEATAVFAALVAKV